MSMSPRKYTRVVGYVCGRVNHITNDEVVLIKTPDGFEDQTATHRLWCPIHNVMVPTSRREGRLLLYHPQEWCHSCKGRPALGALTLDEIVLEIRDRNTPAEAATVLRTWLQKNDLLTRKHARK